MKKSVFYRCLLWCVSNNHSTLVVFYRIENEDQQKYIQTTDLRLSAIYNILSTNSA